eukprot:scaffold6677_cov155-Skeletonema_menzelii.AAC.24
MLWQLSSDERGVDFCAVRGPLCSRELSFLTNVIIGAHFSDNSRRPNCYDTSSGLHKSLNKLNACLSGIIRAHFRDNIDGQTLKDTSSGLLQIAKQVKPSSEVTYKNRISENEEKGGASQKEWPRSSHKMEMKLSYRYNYAVGGVGTNEPAFIQRLVVPKLSSETRTSTAIMKIKRGRANNGMAV